jgi:YfiH family protein
MTDAPPSDRAAILDPAPHGFFGRRGGMSEGLYASLNCGPGSNDDPDAVTRNRARVAAAMGVRPEALLTVSQIHSARVVVADGPFTGARPQADALVTATPSLAVAALAADCAPVLLSDPAARVVAAAHAGWRGALDGVLEATIDAMTGLGARRERIAGVVGPCISQAAYEVGPEFVERFIDADPAHGRFFAGGRGDRAQFALPGFCLARLRAKGVARADWIGRCTHGDPERFFSYRRATQAGEPDYGRQMAAIRPPPG